jgi:hypothetical protein
MAAKRRQLTLAFTALVALAAFARTAPAAVGCELDDPDRDIRRVFPDATGYKTEYITIRERGGAPLAAEVERKLGDRLDAVYEAEDVPHAYYIVLKGKEAIGRVHGVNQKGTFGGMQLILATDLGGRILDFYYQRISSPEAKTFRDTAFTRQFKGLTLDDFYQHQSHPGKGRIAAIRDPSQKSANDFAATLRGLGKNLILLDIFFLDRAHDPTLSEKETQNGASN